MFDKKRYFDSSADDDLTLKNSLISVLLEQGLLSTVIEFMGLQRQEDRLLMPSGAPTKLLQTMAALGFRDGDVRVYIDCIKVISQWWESFLLGTIRRARNHHVSFSGPLLPTRTKSEFIIGRSFRRGRPLAKMNRESAKT